VERRGVPARALGFAPGAAGYRCAQADQASCGCRATARHVELRGFEPRTFSVRTNCATGLRHSPSRGRSGSPVPQLAVPRRTAGRLRAHPGAPGIAR
jgi:hypothetical protein